MYIVHTELSRYNTVIIFHLYTALGFVPGPLRLDENGGSGQICVIKRSGTVPSDGLTVELNIFALGGSQLAG